MVLIDGVKGDIRGDKHIGLPRFSRNSAITVLVTAMYSTSHQRRKSQMCSRDATRTKKMQLSLCSLALH